MRESIGLYRDNGKEHGGYDIIIRCLSLSIYIYIGVTVANMVIYHTGII